jgi:hypothetical protein
MCRHEREDTLRRISLLALAAALLIPAATADAAGPPVMHFMSKSKVAKGFFQGRSVEYFDFGPIKLRPGNKLAPIWVVTNGPSGQRNVIDTVPGRKDYSPLWQVRMVAWKDGATPRVLRSAADVKAAETAGEVTVESTSTVVNCPVLGFGQAKTLGFYRGEGVQYLDLGPLKLASGNKVAPIWVFTNGAAGQRNVIDLAPGDAGYTPLWQVVKVTWKSGAAPRVIRSASAAKAAIAAGDATAAKTATVVNCPVL